MPSGRRHDRRGHLSHEEEQLVALLDRFGFYWGFSLAQNRNIR